MTKSEQQAQEIAQLNNQLQTQLNALKEAYNDQALELANAKYQNKVLGQSLNSMEQHATQLENDKQQLTHENSDLNSKIDALQEAKAKAED